MFLDMLKRLFGSRNQRLLKQFDKIVAQINQLEVEIEKLSDEQLKAKTAEFKERLQKGETLDDILPEAFAVVRQASQRTLKLRHFDMQMIGGIALHKGMISEMRTGEGKTLVATLPAYLNALTGLGVHIITVNDYLARRDALWMEPVYNFLGLTVGTILSGQSPQEKKAGYEADITYGTNNEFGFDYLRDNMAFSATDKVQRALNFAVVDEVDSILIDEARTPLIISGAAEDSSERYIKINAVIPSLQQQTEEDGAGDYSLDEKTKQAFLTEQGHETVEKLLKNKGLLKQEESLYDAANIILVHHVSAALRAHALFQKDVDYIVQDKQIVIVDEHTGRTMPGRRWSDGLHQAIEAKENVPIQNENQTLASITFQNYFRIYTKLSGMTGTADTEAPEFWDIYGLEVLVVPTNKPMVREDLPDQIYLTTEDKFNAVIADVKARVSKQQPVLVGTASIEVSEYLSKLLDKNKIKHQVLNAKFHEKEAQIIAEAGRPGAVTIATNMAGRGTDIVLGGNPEMEIKLLGEKATEEKIAQIHADWKLRHQQVLDAGGLCIIGSERHESRRIDNQLRGRSGRQGDPGSSRFYLSLEDNLMRIFASERVGTMMKKLGMEPGEPLEHSWVTRTVEYAQRRVETFNFDARKQLLEYDNVANEQRKIIYQQRAELLEDEDVSAAVQNMFEDVVDTLVDEHLPAESMEEQWNIEGLELQLEREFSLKPDLKKWLDEDSKRHAPELRDYVLERLRAHYAEKEKQFNPQVMRQLEKSVLLQSLDQHWREHLANLDHLRQGIHLRGYAQKNPKQEYKREAVELFSSMLDNLRYSVVTLLAAVQIRAEADVKAVEEQRRREAESKKSYKHSEASALQQANAENEADQDKTFVREQPKVGRNQSCPCGSGKKYKHCHGKLTLNV